MFTFRRVVCSIAAFSLICSAPLFLRHSRLVAAPEPMVMAKEISDAYGVELQENTAGRVVVSRVIPESPAAEAEMVVGDVIVGIDDAAVLSIKGLAKYLRDKPAGEQATFAIDRQGKKLTFALKAAVVSKVPVLPPGKETGILGMFVVEDTEGRAFVSSVTPGSPADEAGIVKGDRITALGGYVPESYRDMINFTIRLLEKKKAGDELSVRILRRNSYVDTQIVLADRLPSRPRLVDAPAPVTEFRRVAAVAVVQPFVERSLSGFITFTGNPAGVAVVAQLQGLKPGRYRLVIREYGDAGDLEHDSAGGMFGFATDANGATIRPVGDLGPFEPDKVGAVNLVREIPGLRIDGPTSILGHIVTIDQQPTTPDAPATIQAYGVIGVGHPRRLLDAGPASSPPVPAVPAAPVPASPAP